MNAPHARTRRTRRARRARRQRGAVLFVVLMIVTLSTLAATFAVQDTTYELSGTRGLAQAVTARYTAESGINTLPSVLSHYRPDDLRALLLRTASVNSTSFPNEKFHVPPPVGNAYSPFSSDDFETLAYSGAVTAGVEPLLQDARSPYTNRYEAVYESYCGGSGATLLVTISAYGRQTLGWDESAQDYSTDGIKLSGDDNHYHDTVSLARSYYTANLLTPCGGGSI